jgi:methylaspartate mutase sigma subunit
MSAGHSPEVVLSAVASDSHTWNLIFLELLLTEMGCKVRNLGACVPDDLLVGDCRRLRPDLLVLSSVNGHGVIDGQRVIRALRSTPGLSAVPAVIGGKLGTDGTVGEDARRGRLIAAGFDAVFEGQAAVAGFRAFVRELCGALPGLRGTP